MAVEPIAGGASHTSVLPATAANGGDEAISAPSLIGVTTSKSGDTLFVGPNPNGAGRGCGPRVREFDSPRSLSRGTSDNGLAHLLCTQEVGVRFPGSPLREHGLMA